MNKLKHINNRIKFYNEMIENLENCPGNYPEERKFYMERLKMYKEIKADLEAWEAVKPRLKIGAFITMDRIPISHTSYRVIGKALEVKDEKS